MAARRILIVLGVSILCATTLMGTESALQAGPPGTLEALSAPEAHPTPSLPPGVSEEWWEQVQRGLLAENGAEGGAAAPASPSGLGTTPAWTTSGDEDSANLGISAAAAGDVNGDGFGDVIVGAQSHDAGVAGSNRGRAYVYLGSATGPAATPAWVGSGDENGALFGCAVATAGDVNGDGYSDVVVGAYRHNAGLANDRGRAYVFHGSASGPDATAAWVGSGTQDLARYGIAVATAGDVNGDGYSDLLVGASLFDAAPGADCGQVSVYLGSSSGLASTAVRTYAGDQSGAMLGLALATAGDVDGDGFSDLLLGAMRYDVAGTDRGRAYVYRGSSSGPQGTPNWVGSGDQDGANFGAAVSTAGDVDGDGYSDILVGAPLHDAGGSDRGRAYLFRGSDLGTLSAVSWEASGDENGAGLGSAVAAAGDVDGDGYADVAVGAPLHDGGGAANANRGRAYLFQGGASGLATTPAWTASGDEDGASFGQALFTAGDVGGDGFSDLVVGAPNHDGGGAANANRGRAYLYVGAADLPASTAAWTFEGTQPDAQVGYALASAGDLNGDGYSDVVLGVPAYDHSTADEGQVYVFYGSATGLPSTPSWTQGSITVSGGRYGNSVASAGDVNGDGYGDLVVGCPGCGYASEGIAYLFAGSPSGLGSDWAWIASGIEEFEGFGHSASSAGDVNGDGYSDVVIGSSNPLSAFDDGTVSVFLGSRWGLAASPVWRLNGTDLTNFGFSVACAGDVNRDGRSDIVVGALRGGSGSHGRAFLYRGTSTGLESGAWTIFEAASTDQYFGHSVSGAGDVNGDGYSDVLVGAPRAANGQILEGRALLYYGPTMNGFDTTPDWTVEGGVAYAYLGYSVAGAGDLNGDGYSDVVLGAPRYGGGSGAETKVYLGSSSGPGSAPDWVGAEEQTGSWYGASVCSGGDVDGDGFSDLLVGAPYFNGTLAGAGKVYFYPGNGAAGKQVLARQYRDDEYLPIAPLGRSIGGDFWHLLTARSPFGRAGVKLEWQTVPLATAFDPGAAALSRGASWTDSGAGGALLMEEEVLAGVNGAYCWRVRALYQTSDAPFQRHGPWKTLYAQGQRQSVLRKVPPCVYPDFDVSVAAGFWDGPSQSNTFTIEDPNPPEAVTGYNVRLTADPTQNPLTWTQVGFNAPDGDSGTPGVQWTDTLGAPSPGICVYYQITAYSDYCGEEGPF